MDNRNHQNVVNKPVTHRGNKRHQHQCVYDENKNVSVDAK